MNNDILDDIETLLEDLQSALDYMRMLEDEQEQEEQAQKLASLFSQGAERASNLTN